MLSPTEAQNLDDLVAINVMGWRAEWTNKYGGMDKYSPLVKNYCWLDSDDNIARHYGNWHPSENIEHAWLVIDKIHKEIFSIRRKFCNELKRQFPVKDEPKCLVAWPAAIFFLKPVHICHAALYAKKLSSIL